MTNFANIDQAAHSGANGHNNLPAATLKQRLAGNYLKGRLTIAGLNVAIESPRGTQRHWQAEDGTTGTSLMKFHYGYIERTKGNDGDELDCSIGPAPEATRAYVINQFVKGRFDEHKIMLGFPDKRTAMAGYLSNYTPGWQGLDSCIACSIEQLKWWIAHGNKKRPLTQDQLPHEGTDIMDKVIWDGMNNPLRSTLDQVLYSLRAHDANDGLLFDSVCMADILADSDGVLAMDALIVPFVKIEQRMAILQKVIDRAGDAIKVAALQVSDPFTQRGTTNVAVIFELTDGQTVSIFFHNPDVTPKKIMPSDDLISWKWMLNKKDITVAVAPERGRDLDVRIVAARIMRLAERNSARFIAANGKRAERLQSIAGLKDELATKEVELASLEKQIEVATVEMESRPAPVEVPAVAPVSALLSDEEQAALQRRLSELADVTGKLSDDQIGLVASILGVVNAQSKERNTLLNAIYANHPDDIENAIERWKATNPVEKEYPHYSTQILDALVANHGWQKSATGSIKKDVGGALAGELNPAGVRTVIAEFDALGRYLSLQLGFDEVFNMDCRDKDVTEAAAEFNAKVDAWAAESSPAAAVDDFALSAESEDEARARIEQAEADAAAQAAAEAAQASADREALAQKEIDARQAASAENFELGQSADDSLSGQKSILDLPADEPAVDPLAGFDPAKGAAEKFLQSIIEGVADLGDAGLPAELKSTYEAYKDDVDFAAMFKLAVKAYSAYAVSKANAALTK